ncbi:unnamed protein product [Timema podura]|uniref:Uncharacterized protein n=1 Tax=Timema podura TaxID=61482 RepID=A0ABN7PCC5_TIMPD|nr:unnamed protein product [Timema podura]
MPDPCCGAGPHEQLSSSLTRLLTLTIDLTDLNRKIKVQIQLVASRGVNVAMAASVPTANVPQEPRLELEPRTSLNSSADKLTDKYPTQPDPLTY